MTLLRVVVGDTGPLLRGERVTLRHPAMTDYQAWSDLRSASRAFLTPWEPSWPADDLTRSAYKRRIKRYQRDLREDLGAAFFVFRGDADLIGGLTLSGIRRGVTQSCSLGYWMGARFAGQGYMSDAVRTVIPFVFDELRLHRLEAASMPSNTRSVTLLEKVGFSREGFARRYLLINGQWQDHLLFAMLADDPRPTGRSETLSRLGAL
jgi:ribosomal-protein-alanine N-acetyltransferase